MKQKKSIASFAIFMITFMIFTSNVSVADTSIHTQIHNTGGKTYLKKTVNDKTIEIEADEPIQITTMINDNEFKASINDEMLNDYGNIKTELINAFHIFMILIVFLYYYVINRKYKEYKWGNKK